MLNKTEEEMTLQLVYEGENLDLKSKKIGITEGSNITIYDFAIDDTP